MAFLVVYCFRNYTINAINGFSNIGTEPNKFKNEAPSLRSPLKVAAQDDHNAVDLELHEIRAAGMPPSHAAQAVAPG